MLLTSWGSILHPLLLALAHIQLELSVFRCLQDSSKNCSFAQLDSWQVIFLPGHESIRHSCHYSGLAALSVQAQDSQATSGPAMPVPRAMGMGRVQHHILGGPQVSCHLSWGPGPSRSPSDSSHQPLCKQRPWHSPWAGPQAICPSSCPEMAPAPSCGMGRPGCPSVPSTLHVREAVLPLIGRPVFLFPIFHKNF